MIKNEEPTIQMKPLQLVVFCLIMLLCPFDHRLSTHDQLSCQIVMSLSVSLRFNLDA